MHRWFNTKNSQILDLNNFTSFWIEEVQENYRIFGQDKDKIDWNLADFKREEEAKNYLM